MSLGPPEDTAHTHSLEVALVTDEPWLALEKRTFDFFRTRTAPCVSGYFHDPLWDCFVLQVSHTEPTIRHAVNALGALHEERFLRHSVDKSGLDVSRVKTTFPALQYTKALQGLQSLLSKDGSSMDVVLMCAILLVHFESLQESFVPALLHVDHAIRLCKQVSTTCDARKLDTSLVRALVRLDVQGSMFIGMRTPQLAFYTDDVDGKIPSTFRDLTQARDFINTWTGRLLHFIRTESDPRKYRDPGNIPLEVIAQSHDLTQFWVDIDNRLWEFMHKPSVRLTIREQHGLGVLRTRVKRNRILASTCLYTEASMNDKFLPEFEEMLNITSYIMNSEVADRRLFSVSIDEGLVDPLAFICTHCRDSRVRHQALAQLKKLTMYHRSVWYIEATIRSAEVVINFEERFCGKESPKCEDIPEWQRMQYAGVQGWETANTEQKVRVELKLRPNGMDGEFMEFKEVIDWGREWSAQGRLSPASLGAISRDEVSFLEGQSALEGHLVVL